MGIAILVSAIAIAILTGLVVYVVRYCNTWNVRPDEDITMEIDFMLDSDVLSEDRGDDPRKD